MNPSLRAVVWRRRNKMSTIADVSTFHRPAALRAWLHRPERREPVRRVPPALSIASLLVAGR